MRDPAPILLEVSTHRRLVDGAPGLLDLRLTNPGQETLYARVALHGELVDWTSTLEVIQPGAVVEIPVPTRPAGRGTYLCGVHVTAQGSDGLQVTLIGRFDREVAPAATSSASYHVNISAGDGAVIDAAHLRVGQDAPATQRAQPAYSPVPLRADPLAGALTCCNLTDTSGGATMGVLSGPTLSIGRQRDLVDLAVPDHHHQVSRLHCRLSASGGTLWLEHLATTNTTRLNEEEVLGRVPLPMSGPSRVLLGRQTMLELTPLGDAGVGADFRRALAEQGIVKQSEANAPDGGLLLKLQDPDSGRSSLHLWLLGTVRLGDIPDAPPSWTTLVLATFPELFQAELGATGIQCIAPLMDGGRVGACSIGGSRES
ncbi:MAG: FHA domain-containing protein [Phycisphaerales bacterium]|nr:FHA domain-containing protein [Phycisphaerales bacterium]